MRAGIHQAAWPCPARNQAAEQPLSAGESQPGNDRFGGRGAEGGVKRVIRRSPDGPERHLHGEVAFFASGRVNMKREDGCESQRDLAISADLCALTLGLVYF